MTSTADDCATIVYVVGDVDIYSAVTLKEALYHAIDEGARSIVLDATEVTFLDSAGISVFIGGHHRLDPLGGTLAIACNHTVRHVLTVAGLTEVFDLHNNLDDALRRVHDGRPQ